MAQSDYQTFDKSHYSDLDISNLHVGIVHSEWNEEIISLLKNSCQETLMDHGISSEKISSYAVPGSYELPAGAKYLLASDRDVDAIICLGCVIKGETMHDEYISHAVSSAILNLGLLSGKPVIFGVLTTLNKSQAIARADGSHGDKGKESAIAALKMLGLKESLSGKSKKISF